MDKQLRAFCIGGGLGSGLTVCICLVVSWQPLAVTMARFGCGIVLLLSLAAIPWVAEYLIDRLVRAAKLYSFFIQFMYERLQQKRAKKSNDGDTFNSND